MLLYHFKFSLSLRRDTLQELLGQYEFEQGWHLHFYLNAILLFVINISFYKNSSEIWQPLVFPVPLDIFFSSSAKFLSTFSPCVIRSWEFLPAVQQKSTTAFIFLSFFVTQSPILHYIALNMQTVVCLLISCCNVLFLMFCFLIHCWS